jgi:hypothetical protein
MDLLGVSVVAALVAIGGCVAYFVANRLSGLALGLLWAALGAVSVAFISMANSAPGWDGFAYLIFLVLGCGPTGAGMLVGSIVGRVRRA